MRKARPLGLTGDGISLLVVTDDGEQIAIPADERLTAALRGDRARLGQLEIDMESQLRPREIQARVRAGEAVESVAQAAGVPIERIEPFAAPVLAERAHVVGMAIAGTVRRRGEAASVRGLKGTVATRLLQRGLDFDDVEWDAWKRPDGRWVLQAAYESGSRHHVAGFLFDIAGRFSIAEDDEARWLIEENTPAHGPQPGRRRPTDPDNEPTIDLDDELALVRATLTENGPDAYGLATGLQDIHDYAPAELAEVDGVYDLVPPRTEMDVLYDMISGIDEDSVRIYKGLQQPVTPRGEQAPARDEPEQLALFAEHADAQPIPPRPPRKSAKAPRVDAPEEAVSEADAPEAEEPQAPTKRSRGKRASVPTWDEIMFGPKD